MGYIFNIPVGSLDTGNTEKALKQIWKYLKTLEDQLEYKLTNLDSTNIRTIDTKETAITAGDNTVLAGDLIDLKSGKQRFTVGIDTDSNTFKFELINSSGTKVLYLVNGNLVIDKSTEISIDGGDW